MLPLWIIDLTQNSDAQGAFKKRISQISGAFTDVDAVEQFVKLYDNKKPSDTNNEGENSESCTTKPGNCVWYYSHISNPFSSDENFRRTNSDGESIVEVNIPFSNEVKFDWDEYLRSPSLPSDEESHATEKLRRLEEREGKYRHDLVRDLYRNYQEVVVAKGQSLIDLLSRSMSKAKEDALNKENEATPKEIADSLYEDLQRNLNAEKDSFKNLLDSMLAEAKEKANKDAQIIAATKARAISEKHFAFQKDKFDRIYSHFCEQVQQEAVNFENSLKSSSSDVNDDASQAYKNAVDEVESAYSKGVFETLYQKFQTAVVKESKTFMEMLTKEIDDAETNLVAMEEREFNYHKHIAQKLYVNFQEEVVKHGQRFIQLVRRTRAKACTTYNICIIGDSTEDFSRLVFPTVAAMLQKEKGRILPDHIHQGLSILGALFIPSDINSRDVHLRNKVRRTIDEIEVQHQISSARGYDKVLYYQDVQNRTENFYPLLSVQDRVDYLFQCMVNLYYACSEVHPLLSGTASDDKFYFSFGPAALFYDSTIQDKKDQNFVANNLINEFLKDGDGEREDTDLRYFSAEDFLDELTQKQTTSEQKEENKKKPAQSLKLSSTLKPEKMLECFDDISVDIGNFLDPKFTKDPNFDFYDETLERIYYKDELKFYPAKLKFYMKRYVDDKVSSVMEECSKKRTEMTKNMSACVLPDALRELLRSCDKNTGGLKRAEKGVSRLKDNIGSLKKYVDQFLEETLWNKKIINKPTMVPEDFQEYFIEIHSSYVADLKNPTNKSYDSAREKASEDLKNVLQRETPMLSQIARVFLQSLIAVIWGIPLLHMLSPDEIDLGNIYENTIYWVIGIFLIPVLLQGIRNWMYHLRRKRVIRQMKAFYLHDAYARLANRIYSEIICFYDDARTLCDKYLDRFQKIRDEKPSYSSNDIPSELPVTKFSQDVISGSFEDEPVTEGNEDSDGYIRIKYSTKSAIKNLTREDYFALIGYYNDDFFSLVSGIGLANENYYDAQKGIVVFKTLEQQKQEEKETWENIKKNFETNLRADIKKDILPRENSTVCEKIWEYYQKYQLDLNPKASALLHPFIRIASTNGEFTTSADIEYVDIKANSLKVEELVTNFLHVPPNIQLDSKKDLFKHYMFLTRWKTFDYVHLNRVLPQEDFDDQTRSIRVSKVNDDRSFLNKCYPSSLFLLSVCEVGLSRCSEWWCLFPEGIPTKVVLSDMKAYQDVLNVDD